MKFSCDRPGLGCDEWSDEGWALVSPDLLGFNEELFFTQDVELGGFIEDTKAAFKNLFQTGIDVARASGVAVPMDRDIEMLRAKRDEIKAKRLQAESLLDKVVPRIKAQGDPKAIQVADKLKAQGQNDVAKAYVTVQYYARAIIAAQNLQAGLLAGKPDAEIGMDYATKKKLAEAEGAMTVQRLDQFFRAVDAGYAEVVGLKDSVTKQILAIPGEVAREVYAAAKPAAIIGAKTLPWIIGVGAALYGLTLLQPLLRARRSM